MLFVLFQIGSHRYALPARRVVEVVPMVAIQRLSQARKGLAGVFDYRGRLVPAVDLSELLLNEPAKQRLSTRIILVEHQRPGGDQHLIGLIAEHATEIIRRDPSEFATPATELATARLGPVLGDINGPVQVLLEDELLPEPVRALLFENQPI